MLRIYKREYDEIYLLTVSISHHHRNSNQSIKTTSSEQKKLCEITSTESVINTTCSPEAYDN